MAEGKTKNFYDKKQETMSKEKRQSYYDHRLQQIVQHAYCNAPSVTLIRGFPKFLRKRGRWKADTGWFNAGKTRMTRFLPFSWYCGLVNSA